MPLAGVEVSGGAMVRAALQLPAGHPYHAWLVARHLGLNGGHLYWPRVVDLVPTTTSAETT